jgi:hypothetical protein
LLHADAATTTTIANAALARRPVMARSGKGATREAARDVQFVVSIELEQVADPSVPDIQSAQ